MDFCCGLTMVARLQNVYSDGPVLIQDVPILYCPTCLNSAIAPDVEIDYLLYAHHCETDGIHSGSLSSAIGDDKILEVMEAYPDDERVKTGQRVIQDQVDAALDLLNFAQAQKDAAWSLELLERLRLFREVSNLTRS